MAGPVEDAPAPQVKLGAPPVIARRTFLRANAATARTPEAPHAGTVTYFIAPDLTGWRTNVPTDAGLTYSKLYPGSSLSYTGNGVPLQGTYLVAAAVDPLAGPGCRQHPGRWDGQPADRLLGVHILILGVGKRSLRRGSYSAGKVQK
jgi:hypothetical protein